MQDMTQEHDKGCNCHHPWHAKNDKRKRCSRRRKNGRGKCAFCKGKHVGDPETVNIEKPEAAEGQ